jgi:small subunit ribosomal protein S20
MPNTRSAEKQLRKSLKRRLRNRFYRTRARNLIKEVLRYLAAGDVESARSLLPKAYAAIDKAEKVGVFHRNTAARYKSRIARRLAAAQGVARPAA